jgi:hypothetical protein
VGKRSNFERRPQDKYYTPEAAVIPLLRHLPPQITFVEPCAGDARLITHLEKAGHTCTYACDIEPDSPRVRQQDALTIPVVTADYVITNPPWRRQVFHPLIEHLSALAPTWFLADANWMFTKQAGPYIKLCSKIVTVGRIKWIEGSKMTGKDDCVWYLFGKHATTTQFYPR